MARARGQYEEEPCRPAGKGNREKINHLFVNGSTNQNREKYVLHQLLQPSISEHLLVKYIRPIRIIVTPTLTSYGIHALIRVEIHQ
jgi:hypothetical protein